MREHAQIAISINLLELCGMFMTALVIQTILTGRPNYTGDPVLMVEDTASSKSLVNRCGVGERERGFTR